MTTHPGSGPRRLMRSRDRKLAGVCGGIAEYLDLDPTVVRVVFVVLLLFPFFPLVGGVVLYLLLWLVMPEPVAPAGPPPARSVPAVEPFEPAPAGSLPAAPASQAADDGGRAGARLLGGVLLAAGVLFLLQRAAGPWWPAWWMPNLMMLGWPLLLIVIGGLILLSASSRRP
jgi:phage shock protein C